MLRTKRKGIAAAVGVPLFHPQTKTHYEDTFKHSHLSSRNVKTISADEFSEDELGPEDELDPEDAFRRRI